MLRIRTGVAGSAAGAKAAAEYFLGETLKPENDALARYYAGETAPEPGDGVEALGQAIADGETSFSEAADELIAAHGRLFGYPDDMDALEDRITRVLNDAATRADMREAVAEEGGTVARVREDLAPRMARLLGIDTARQLTQGELAHLLAGARADGAAIEGKQIQRAGRSIAEVFGLDASRLPSAEEIESVLAGRRPDGADQLPDKVIEGARKRFLAVYGLPSKTDLQPDHIDHLKAGRSATGRLLDTGDVMRRLNATKQPISYMDCIWSADKSVSVAWALAPTEAERAIIVQAHRRAVAEAMAYTETHLGFSRKGANSEQLERGVTCWITCDHYTSRPTAEVAMTDKNGEAYTEFQAVPIRDPDMQLHSHALLLNAVLTDSGRVGSMDLDRTDGLVKELGATYQAVLARNLRAHGIDARLDPETGAARIMTVPAHVTRHFSKRTQDIEAAAHRYAAEEGLDWSTMTGAHQLKFLRKGVEETRRKKEPGDGDSDFTAWLKQAVDEISYRHRSVLRPGEEQAMPPDMERYRVAYETSLGLIEEALGKKAKLDASEFREFATRGLINAGISNAPAADIKTLMQMYREHGVRQSGEMTAIEFGKDVPVRGKERWSVTTAMHIDEETTVVALAKEFSADRSRALSSEAIERSSQAFLAAHPEIKPDDPQWIKQREVIEKLATGGRLGVAIGVAGAGKTTLMAPIVAAMREDGRHVHGIARGWKQAQALRESGVQPRDVAAVSVFLTREDKGKIKLDDQSVVVVDELSQIGRGDMLRLMKLQQQHGFTMLAIGDNKQIGSIEAPVMDLLVKTLGDEVPEILTSIRQATEREKEITGLFRDGKAGEAIGLKLEDGTAELVAGGRGPTIRKIAEKWQEVAEADPTLQPTIGTASNKDAHDIGVAIRQKLQEDGKIGPDKITVPVLSRGETGVHPLPLAEGDKVRVFNRVLADGHFASNGDVLTVVDVAQAGMTARNDAGKEATINWSQLHQEHESTPRLEYGHALTIDAAQGITSKVHIDAILSGSELHQGGKGYVNESRQTDQTIMIVNEAAERKRIYSRIPRGEYQPVQQADIWKHVADNLSRPSTKASALEFMKLGSEIHRGNVSALPDTLEPAERREKVGEERATIQQAMEVAAAEREASEAETPRPLEAQRQSV